MSAVVSPLTSPTHRTIAKPSRATPSTPISSAVSSAAPAFALSAANLDSPRQFASGAATQTFSK